MLKLTASDQDFLSELVEIIEKYQRLNQEFENLLNSEGQINKKLLTSAETLLLNIDDAFDAVDGEVWSLIEKHLKGTV